MKAGPLCLEAKAMEAEVMGEKQSDCTNAMRNLAVRYAEAVDVGLRCVTAMTSDTTENVDSCRQHNGVHGYFNPAGNTSGCLLVSHWISCSCNAVVSLM